MSGRIIPVTIRGRRIEIDYIEPAGQVFHPLWHCCHMDDILWLTEPECRLIDAACLLDLIAQRAAWRAQIERRKRRLRDERVGEGARAP